MARERIVLLDWWISLLIVSVILGHCSFSFAPEWYEQFHAWVYSFHMGAFFFAAGFLVKYTYKELHSWGDYCRYLVRKLKKFGIPFLILGISLSMFAVWRKNGDGDAYISALTKLFIDPMSSQVLYLWFIYVLFFYYILAPLFCQFSRFFLWVGCLAALYLAFFPLPRLFAMHCFSAYLIFFLSGIAVCCYWDYVKRIPFRLAWCAVPVFVWSSYVSPGPYICSGFSSLPCLFLLSFYLSKILSMRSIVTTVSRDCFSIYLYQMIFMNLLALLFLRLPKNVFFFLLFMAVGLVSSIVGSIAFAEGLRRLALYRKRRKCGQQCA